MVVKKHEAVAKCGSQNFHNPLALCLAIHFTSSGVVIHCMIHNFNTVIKKECGKNQINYKSEVQWKFCNITS